MIVTKETFSDVVNKFSQTGFYGYDCETFGLSFHDRLFSVIFANAEDGYYFNFFDAPEALPNQILPRSWIIELQSIFANPRTTLSIHNAKFDLQKTALEHLVPYCQIHCTQLTARILKNNYLNYSLDSCAGRMDPSYRKDKTVEEYIKKHKLYETSEIEGKKGRKTKKFFFKVPLPIIAPYGIQDAKLHRALGLYQLDKIIESNGKKPDFNPAYEVEHNLLPVTLSMEQHGIRIDRDYVRKALAFEKDLVFKSNEEFKELTGVEFVDSPKTLKPIFEKHGVTLPLTEKGNPSLTKAVLNNTKSPISDLVKKIRNHSKRAGTYYSSFLFYADYENVMHPQIRQNDTDTGRFAYAEPNLQNLNKEEESKEVYQIRRSCVPRPGFCFGMADYDQQEFRMFLDYAGEENIIREILGGKDVHQATADEIGVTRTQAKTINFMLLYGGGGQKLANMLKCSLLEAKILKKRYFAKLPKVQKLIHDISEVGKKRGFITNWIGRPYYCPDNTDHSYVLTNHLIQGGCAYVVKKAMIEVHQFLTPYKSRIIAQIHDELLFEIHESELHLAKEIKKIMENIYTPRNGLPLTCSFAHSWKSLSEQDKVKGYPYVI